jgi:predicted GNAT superfamily acetyltransferase
MMSEQMIIRPLDTMQDVNQVEELQLRVWPGSERDVVPGHILITLAHNGATLLGAFDGDRLVGFVLGFLGLDSDTPERVAMARLKHCSHMLGVDPAYQDHGIGMALKLAQRREVEEQGIRLITWTYDPLQSRNAHLNIRRLGGIARTYLANAYGEMRDELNQGVSSDRFLLEWWITSPRVVARIDRSRAPLDLANFLAAGAQKVNPAVLRHDDLLEPADSLQPMEGNLLLVEIPGDFDRIRQRDIGLAAAWREHTRHIFESGFEQGYMATDFVHLGEEKYPRSYYLLIQGEGTLG